jgi:hypothetical protein
MTHMATQSTSNPTSDLSNKTISASSDMKTTPTKILAPNSKLQGEKTHTMIEIDSDKISIVTEKLLSFKEKLKIFVMK